MLPTTLAIRFEQRRGCGARKRWPRRWTAPALEGATLLCEALRILGSEAPTIRWVGRSIGLGSTGQDIPQRDGDDALCEAGAIAETTVVLGECIGLICPESGTSLVGMSCPVEPSPMLRPTHRIVGASEPRMRSASHNSVAPFQCWSRPTTRPPFSCSTPTTLFETDCQGGGQQSTSRSSVLIHSSAFGRPHV